MASIFDAIMGGLPGQTEEEKRQALASGLLNAGAAMYEASQGQPGMGRPGLGGAIISGARGFGQGIDARQKMTLEQRDAEIKRQMQALQMQALQQAQAMQQKQLAAQERFAASPNDAAALASAYPELAAKAAYERQAFPMEMAKAQALAGVRASMLNPLQQAELEQMQEKVTAARNEKAIQQENALGTLQSTIANADALLKHPGLNSAVGKSSYFPSVRGSNAYDFEAQLESFKAQTFIPMVSALKGMGALSDAEGKKLEAAVGALKVGMSEERFKDEMNRIKNDLITKAQRVKRGIGSMPNDTDKQAEALAVLGGGMQ